MSRQKNRYAIARRVVFVVVLVSCVRIGYAEINYEWVTIGDAGNAPRKIGSKNDDFAGAVPYVYRIGKLEITNEQYAEFLNAVAADDPNELYRADMDIGRVGDLGNYEYSVAQGRENIPVTFVSFWDCIRFANWLHNRQPKGRQESSTTEDGAYTITVEGIENNTITRNQGATFFVPTLDEWFKAAYYKSGSDDAGYWEYPTKSNAAPIAEIPPGGPSSANYDSVITGPTDVGSYVESTTPYGTLDQGGNVREWNETALNRIYRGIHGGDWLSGADDLKGLTAKYPPFFTSPADEGPRVGFRVASIPEPSSKSLAWVALFGFILQRRSAPESRQARP